MSVAGFAPLYLFPVPILTLAFLLHLWPHAAGARSAARLGWWFGLGFFLTGVSWVNVSLHDFGAMPAPLAALATLLFCAYLALFPALVGYAFRRLPGTSTLKALLLVPALWTLAEWTRGWLFTGFPWLAMGYSQVPSSPLAGYAPVLGIYGVTLATLASAAFVFLIAQRVLERRRMEVRQGPGIVRPHSSRCSLARRIRALAGALDPSHGRAAFGRAASGQHPTGDQVDREGFRATLITYRDLALASDARLIVLPETALPLFLHEVPPDYLRGLAAHASATAAMS